MRAMLCLSRKLMMIGMKPLTCIQDTDPVRIKTFACRPSIAVLRCHVVVFRPRMSPRVDQELKVQKQRVP